MQHRHISGGFLAAIITTLAIGLLVAPFAGTPAFGASVRECGNYGYTASGAGPMWTSRQIQGATPAYNLTTRNVACATARRFALRYRGTDSYFPTWRCRETNDYEFSDVRCTASGGRVIHWQAGS